MFDLFKSNNKDDLDAEHEAFLAKREYERDVVETAMKNWILQSGLGPIFLEQMEDYAIQAQGYGWTDQQRMYDVDQFDPRREMHREILEFIEEREE